MISATPWLFALLIAIAPAGMAAAQAAQRPLLPYPEVAIVLAKPAADDSFDAFRAELAAVARRRIYVALTRLLRADNFFWERDFGQGFDPRRPPVDNLAAALALESRNGSGWEQLAALAAEAAVEPLPSRPGVVCAPAHPSYDGVAYAKLLDTTYTTGLDWAYPRAADTAVYAAPATDAAPAGSLGLHFVQLLGFAGPDDDPAPGRNQWARIVMPDGRPGFVAPGSLMSLTTEQLCYIKDPIAGWRIAGTVAGGHWQKSQR